MWRVRIIRSGIVGVGLAVVEFFGRFFLPEDRLRGVELAFLKHTVPDASGRGLEHVAQMLRVVAVRHVVADVVVALVAHGSRQVVTLVHPRPVSVAVLWLRDGKLAGERAALHPLGRLDASEAEDCRREVDEANQTVGCSAV